MPLSKIVANSITDNTITTDQIADTSVHGRRNILINGAMQVSQRGTSASATTANGYNVCDRWHQSMSSSGTFTLSQSAIAPSGFANSFKFDCTAADSSPSNIIFAQRVEGQNLQMLKKGTSDALSATLSFYIRSNKTGTYQVNMYDTDNTRIIGKTYTIDSADTWEYKTLTFAGDTSGAFADDNGGSLELEWWFAAGSSYNSGAVPTAWEAKSDGDRAAGLTVNIGDNTSNELFITGIQLEVGDKATPFEHRSFGEELALCQRYYQVPTNNAMYAATSNGSSQIANIGVPLVTTLRADPTASTLAATPTAWHGNNNGTSGSTNAPTLAMSTQTHSTTVKMTISGFSGLTDNRAATITVNGLVLDSEL